MEHTADDPAQKRAINASIIEDAASVLSDVVQWQLTERNWTEVTRVLAAMAAAMTTGDMHALMNATVELEILSPVRVARLGDPLVGPPPPAVRLVHNQLVYDLGVRSGTVKVPAKREGQAGGSPRPTEILGAPVAVDVAQQELVIHMFAPLDGPRARDRYEKIRALWTRCTDVLAAGEPVPQFDLPVDLPSDLMLMPVTPAIAAVQKSDASFQAILRVDHDVLNLSVLCASARGLDNAVWSALDREWRAVATDDTDDLLGVARLYLGLAPAHINVLDATAGIARDLVPEPPLGADNDWLERGCVVAGCAMWELSRRDGNRVERHIMVLADAGADDLLSAWAWSRGGLTMTPFTQYLMHTAKLRFEARVRDRAAGTLPLLATGGASPGELTDTITRLKDMRVTSKVAQQNMAALLGPVPRSGLVEDDNDLARWLLDQLDADVGYLSNARERTEAGIASVAHNARITGALPAPIFGVVTALAEEFTAMRALITDWSERPIAGDRANYLIGTMPSADPMYPHRVVLTLLGETGNPAAAEAVAQLLRSFPTIDQVIMAGIAAGIPNPDRPDLHVRLGDIVVATWGVVAYDHIVDTPDQPRLRQEFPRPSALLAHRAKMLEADEMLGHRPWEPLLDAIITMVPTFNRPSATTDRLFADDGLKAAQLAHPDLAHSGHRPGRPKVHYGRIGSADRSMRNATSRDSIANRYAVRAIEMEGNGIGTAAFASGREWFVVRGISDYADSHVNHDWRRYASATAASYTAALLAQCPPIAAHGGHTHGSHTG